MSWGLIASAAISAGAAIVGGNMAAHGAEHAANTEAQASRDAAQIQEQAQLRFEERMQPYIASGRSADTYVNALLGLPAPQASGAGAAGAPDYEAYVRQNPDLLAQYQANNRGMSIADYGRWHWEGGTTGGRQSQLDHILGRPGEPGETWGGRAEGRDMPVFAAPATSQETYDAAMAAYENSPWARFATESANTAREQADQRFMSTAGARGSVVSGRTAAGLYDIAQRAEDQRFREGFTEGWYPSVTGVSDRGYNASVGVGDASLSTAARVGAATQQAGQAVAEGERSANDAMAQGINSALYYGGQAYDAWNNRPRSSTMGRSSKSGGSKPTKPISGYTGG